MVVRVLEETSIKHKGDDSELAKLRHHFSSVRRHVEAELQGFADLDLAVNSLVVLETRCAESGIDAGFLRMLDGVLAQNETAEAGPTMELSTPSLDGVTVSRTRAAMHVCAGDYFDLFRHGRLARVQFSIAIEADPSNPNALLGYAKSLAEENGRDEAALTVVVRCVCLMSALCAASTSRCGLWDLRVSQALHLLADLVCRLSCPRGMPSLPTLMPFLACPGVCAVESLARAHFATRAIGLPLEWYTIQLLSSSQTFCHVEMEYLVIRWRAALGRLLMYSEWHSTAELASAAAVASHCHFVGYCVPIFENDSVLRDARGKLDISTASWRAWVAAWFTVGMYETPKVSTFDSINRWLQEMDHSEFPIFQSFIQQAYCYPREEAHLTDTLERLGPDGVSATPCSAFYDATPYPPWHAVECAGSIAADVNERFKRLLPWRQGVALPGGRPRILVAGCGSGHQVAVELRTYSACDVVALDCSSGSVARAKRKLRSFLSYSDFTRVRFVVGDITCLTPQFGSFDVVICAGVLHHLSDPEDGLRRLAAVLLPNGILQLSTYSRLNVERWRSGAQSYLRSAASSRHLFRHGVLQRIPTPEEVRVIRAEVFDLPPGNSVRELLHFRDFFTLAGVLDLLFHPLETSFTLLELAAGPLRAAELSVAAVHFPDVNADLDARRRFRQMHGDLDPRMVDLTLWHALEVSDNDTFGRMHTLFLEHSVSCVEARGIGREVKRARRDPLVD